MAGEKASQLKKDQGKEASLTPEVLSPEVRSPQTFAMDGTSHVEISAMQNAYYSKEIIEKTRDEFSIERLRAKIADDKSEFLAEGERQIHELWHGIEALTVHNTMFVVLFLLSIGEVLNEVRNQISLTEFVNWRRRVFHPKQERYLQQAQQLAKMGNFAKKYASMGKKRLLILDKLRKDEDKDTYEALFAEHPIPEEVEESLLVDEQVRQNPFPDSTEDFEGDLLIEHVDALITFHRLKKAEINFVTFDQAYLIAAYKKNALPIKNAKKVADWLNGKGTIRTQKKWFNILVMNKMIFPERQSRSNAPQDSMNYMLANFVEYCKRCDFTDRQWVENQSELIESEIVRESNFYLKKVARVFSINLSARQSN
jgi:hypothetical protein